MFEFQRGPNLLSFKRRRRRFDCVSKKEKLDKLGVYHIAGLFSYHRYVRFCYLICLRCCFVDHVGPKQMGVRNEFLCLDSPSIRKQSAVRGVEGPVCAVCKCLCTHQVLKERPACPILSWHPIVAVYFDGRGVLSHLEVSLSTSLMRPSGHASSLARCRIFESACSPFKSSSLSQKPLSILVWQEELAGSVDI